MVPHRRPRPFAKPHILLIAALPLIAGLEFRAPPQAFAATTHSHPAWSPCLNCTHAQLAFRFGDSP
mgnify:CR=1 FL=1